MLLGLPQIFFSGLKRLRTCSDEGRNGDQGEYGQEPAVQARHIASDCAGSLAEASTQRQEKRDPRCAAQLLA